MAFKKNKQQNQMNRIKEPIARVGVLLDTVRWELKTEKSAHKHTRGHIDRENKQTVLCIQFLVLQSSEQAISRVRV